MQIIIKKNLTRPLAPFDLFYAGLLFAGLLILPSYLAFFYKITFAMGGWRVPLIKLSWFYSFFIFSNLFWLLWFLFSSLKPEKGPPKGRLYLVLFLISNTLGAFALGTDFVHYNLFKEHWNIGTITAAFIGIAGGQAPLGIAPVHLLLAIALFLLLQMLSLVIARFIPRPNHNSRYLPFFLSLSAFFFLILLIAFQRYIPSNWHSLHLQQYIPWITFIPDQSSFPIDDEQLLNMRHLETEKDQALLNMARQLDGLSNIQAKRKPNILMIHVEGMRSDMLQAKYMPQLTAFAGKEGEILENHYSSSNNTGQSMFSLLTGLYGTWYQNFRQSPTRLAPLFILEKLGYTFTVHNSMPDDYENLGNLLFPNFIRHEVLDESLEKNEIKLYREAADRLAGFRQGDSPRFDYLFLNSTHFPYSYPEAFRQFSPVLDNMSYDTSIRSNMEKNKAAVRNTFLNSVYFADHLLGSLLNSIHKTEYWKNTIVIIVGDHGQEFWEHNRFGHVYGLTKEQTQVIAYISFPSDLKTRYRYTSHYDFFPTIFSYMSLNKDVSGLMNGKNLYDYQTENDFALVRMSVLASQKRFEEGIITKDLKVTYHLKEKLSIQSVTDEDDVAIDQYGRHKAATYSLIKKIHTRKQHQFNHIQDMRFGMKP